MKVELTEIPIRANARIQGVSFKKTYFKYILKVASLTFYRIWQE